MTDSNHFDLVIIGAGISGLSVAYAASRSKLKTAVIDLKQPGSGASGAPQALLNPATGRKAKKSWNAEKCLPYSRTILEEVQRSVSFKLYTNNGVIRPALSSDLADKMNLSYKTSAWPDGWVEWLDHNEMRNRFPGLPNADGGLWVPAACTVALKTFIRAFHGFLEARGVNFFIGSEPSLSGSQPWLISGLSKPISAENIVYATGESITYNPIWKMLPLHRVKGQTLTVKLQSQFPFHCSVSSLGYIAQNGDSSGSVVLGSTYEHHYDHPGPDEKGASKLVRQMEKTVPDLSKNVRRATGWSGVRVTTPDKKPFIGKHPEIDNLYAIGAMGSKGLMLGPYLGRILVEYILHKQQIPSGITIERLLS